MKKQVALLILVCLLACGFSGCGNKNEMEFEKLDWPAYDSAKQIPMPKSTMADVRNSGDVSFSFYLADTTVEDYKKYVEACKDKGFVLEPVEQEHKYHAFNENKYELTVRYDDGDIMYVSVFEHRCDVSIKLLHTDKTSADMYDLRVRIDGVWEEDSERGDEVVSLDSYLREGNHTLVIENLDDDDINGRIDFTVSEDDEYFEFEINCLSNKLEIKESKDATTTCADETDSNVTMPENESTDEVAGNNKEPKMLYLADIPTFISNIIEEINEITDDMEVALGFNDFRTLEDIKECEELWAGMAKKAESIQTKFLDSTPPEEFLELWQNIAECMGEMSKNLARGSEFDVNQDGEYTSEEVKILIKDIRDNFVKNATNVLDMMSDVLELCEDKPQNHVTGGGSFINPSCIECGQDASFSYKNLFSGEDEYYCAKHYRELIDMLDSMGLQDKVQ